MLGVPGASGLTIRTLLRVSAKEPVGQPVYVRAFGPGNRVTTTRARMDELFPPEPTPRPSSR